MTAKPNPVPSGNETPLRVELQWSDKGEAVLFIPRGLVPSSNHVMLYRDGDRLIVEPIHIGDRPAGMSDLLTWLASQKPLPPEDQFPEIEDLPPEPRPIF